MTFKSKIRIQGASRILTVPSDIVELLKLDEGDTVLVEIAKLSEDQKREADLRLKYGEPVSGELIYQGATVARLDRVYFITSKFRMGGLGEGQSLDQLPEYTSIFGMITSLVPDYEQIRKLEEDAVPLLQSIHHIGTIKLKLRDKDITLQNISLELPDKLDGTPPKKHLRFIKFSGVEEK